jgi:hypothetical protein
MAKESHSVELGSYGVDIVPIFIVAGPGANLAHNYTILYFGSQYRRGANRTREELGIEGGLGRVSEENHGDQEYRPVQGRTHQRR